MREANEQGLPEPLILPHPDDIQFGPGSYEVRITGPSDESELAVYHAVVVYKKLAIWTTEDHLRRGAKPNIDVGTKKQYWLTILALLLNESSHPRFKLTLSELTKEAICARHASNKELDATIADFEHQLESLEKQFPPIPPVVTKAIEKIRRMMFSKTKHKTV